MRHLLHFPVRRMEVMVLVSSLWLSSSAFPAISLGFTILVESLHVTVFYSNHWGSHILSSWIVHAGCVCVASIHLSRTWTSWSFESMRWNACVHRLDLGVYSLEPTTLHHAGQRAQHTTDWTILAPMFVYMTVTGSSQSNSWWWV